MTVTEQPTYREPTHREHRTMYIVVAAAFVVLLVIALLTHRSKESTEQAQQKANQLIAALSQAGLSAPSQEQIVTVLGDDGGAVCDNPAGALRESILLGQLVNGAAGPGMRPVIADNRVVKGELAIIKVYCPDQLPGFQEFVNGLNLDQTVKS
jgi:Tfp pilus assembly protein FimT